MKKSGEVKVEMRNATAFVESRKKVILVINIGLKYLLSLNLKHLDLP